MKIAKPFINDSMSSLYLATHLWTRVWPDQYGNSREDITVDATRTAELLRGRFGGGRTTDVKHAMELLDTLGLAAEQPDGTWIVSRTVITRRGEKDVHRILAARISSTQRRAVPRAVRPGPAPEQGTLFDS